MHIQPTNCAPSTFTRESRLIGKLGFNPAERQPKELIEQKKLRRAAAGFAKTSAMGFLQEVKGGEKLLDIITQFETPERQELFDRMLAHHQFKNQRAFEAMQQQFPPDLITAQLHDIEASRKGYLTQSFEQLKSIAKQRGKNVKNDAFFETDETKKSIAELVETYEEQLFHWDDPANKLISKPPQSDIHYGRLYKILDDLKVAYSAIDPKADQFSQEATRARVLALITAVAHIERMDTKKLIQHHVRRASQTSQRPLEKTLYTIGFGTAALVAVMTVVSTGAKIVKGEDVTVEDVGFTAGYTALAAWMGMDKDAMPKKEDIKSIPVVTSIMRSKDFTKSVAHMPDSAQAVRALGELVDTPTLQRKFIRILKEAKKTVSDKSTSVEAALAKVLFGDAEKAKFTEDDPTTLTAKQKASHPLLVQLFDSNVTASERELFLSVLLERVQIGYPQNYTIALTAVDSPNFYSVP